VKVRPPLLAPRDLLALLLPCTHPISCAVLVSTAFAVQRALSSQGGAISSGRWARATTSPIKQLIQRTPLLSPSPTRCQVSALLQAEAQDDAARQRGAAPVKQETRQQERGGKRQKVLDADQGPG